MLAANGESGVHNQEPDCAKRNVVVGDPTRSHSVCQSDGQQVQTNHDIDEAPKRIVFLLQKEYCVSETSEEEV